MGKASPSGESWRLKAACRGKPAELFFPKPGAQPWRGRALCRSCEVRDSCYQHALDNEEEWGLWGGVTETERRLLQARRRN